MSGSHAIRPSAAVPALELARIGSRPAATAFGALLRRPIRPGVPEARAETGLRPHEAATTGVVFEVEGALSGLICLLIPPLARRALIAALCPGASSSSRMAASALREAGNIVASHAVSALADRFGVRITISPPTLIEAEAAYVFEQMVAERSGGSAGVVTETALSEDAGPRRALLLFSPDAP
jgi:chemotaxis protein CheY-P-specific phosphatase CheC